MRSLLVAALCCAMRPTVGVLYVPLGVHLLAHFRRARLQILAAAAAVGYASCQAATYALLADPHARCVGNRAVTAAVTMVTDHAFYGRWILTPWAFVRFNVTSGLSRVYGVHPWYWYFVAGLPINIAGFLPFFLHGICRASSRALLLCILWVTAAYSALAHKEHRFLFCVLQPMYCYVGVSLHRLLHDKHRKRAQWTRAVLGILVVLNLAGVYVGNMVHGTGMIDVIHALRHELRRHGTDTADVGVLSSCHSTPAYSHLHAKVPMWSLGCPPPLEYALSLLSCCSCRSLLIPCGSCLAVHRADPTWTSTRSRQRPIGSTRTSEPLSKSTSTMLPASVEPIPGRCI